MTTTTSFFDIDAATEDQWAAYHLYRRLRAAEDTPDEPVLSNADFEHLVRRQWPLVETRRFIARTGDKVIGNLYLESRRKGSPDYDTFAPFIGIGGGVLHPHRRRGVGTALLRWHAAGAARAWPGA
ncbi:hypothetical protein WKW79_18905 [Variovorax robiniae]|uniref:N-acetyltransferase domain-containing protein n=1 Tax=Variovorax robiniae TaxID=1836199 RepID=A0ABU8X9Z8_9BURK